MNLPLSIKCDMYYVLNVGNHLFKIFFFASGVVFPLYLITQKSCSASDIAGNAGIRTRDLWCANNEPSHFLILTTSPTPNLDLLKALSFYF